MVPSSAATVAPSGRLPEVPDDIVAKMLPGTPPQLSFGHEQRAQDRLTMREQVALQARIMRLDAAADKKEQESKESARVSSADETFICATNARFSTPGLFVIWLGAPDSPFPRGDPRRDLQEALDQSTGARSLVHMVPFKAATPLAGDAWMTTSSASTADVSALIASLISSDDKSSSDPHAAHGWTRLSCDQAVELFAGAHGGGMPDGAFWRECSAASDARRRGEDADVEPFLARLNTARGSILPEVAFFCLNEMASRAACDAPGHSWAELAGRLDELRGASARAHANDGSAAPKQGDVAVYLEARAICFRVGDATPRPLAGSEEWQAQPAESVARAGWFNAHLAAARAYGGAVAIEDALEPKATREDEQAIAVAWSLVHEWFSKGAASSDGSERRPGGRFPAHARPLAARVAPTPTPLPQTSGLAADRKGGQCAAPGCANTGVKLCSACKAEAYCSAECQKAHWKAHKRMCRHVAAGKGARPSAQDVLAIPRWTRDTSADDKERHLDLFEARHEKAIAIFAREHSQAQGAGVVVANLAQPMPPLDLHYTPVRLINTPREPACSREIVDEIEDAHRRGSYVVMAVNGEWRGARKRGYWNGAPIHFYRFGGRGSTQYAGPATHYTSPVSGPLNVNAVIATLKARHPTIPDSEARRIAEDMAARQQRTAARGGSYTYFPNGAYHDLGLDRRSPR